MKLNYSGACASSAITFDMKSTEDSAIRGLTKKA